MTNSTQLASKKIKYVPSPPDDPQFDEHGNAICAPTYSEVLEIADKLYLMGPSMRRAFRCVAATILANTEEGTIPLWLMLVGAAAVGKTSSIEPYLNSHRVYKLGVLTAKTLISGAKAQRGEDGTTTEASLLNRLGSHKTLMFTDFSILLSKGREARDEIMGQLRDVYDGEVKGDHGTGGASPIWKGKLGMVAACTEQIVEHAASFAALGERFLYLRMVVEDQMAVLDHVSKVGHRREEWKQELRGKGAEFVDHCADHIKDVAVGTKEDQQIKRLATVVAMLRAGVHHDDYHFDDRIQVYSADSATRVHEQLTQLARGLAALRQAEDVDKADMADCVQIALDSVPFDRRHVAAILLKHEHGGAAILRKSRAPSKYKVAPSPGTGGLLCAEVADRSGVFTYTGCRRALMDLELMGMVAKRGPAGSIVKPSVLVEQGTALRWETTPRLRDLVGDLIQLI